jgi:hypothetical protein
MVAMLAHDKVDLLQNLFNNTFKVYQKLLKEDELMNKSINVRDNNIVLQKAYYMSTLSSPL